MVREPAPAVVQGISTPCWRLRWRAGSKPADVREAALAHAERNAVAEAYQRSDLLERRVPLTQEWSDYVAPMMRRRPRAEPPRVRRRPKATD